MSDPALTPPPMPVRPIAGYGTDAMVTLVFAVIFLWLGLPFAHWLTATLTHQPFETGVNWTEGDRAGTPVAYFDLEGGAAWRDLGAFATAVALGLEAVLCVVATLAPGTTLTAFRVIFAVGVLGVVTNVLAAGMQVRAGFDQPLIALVGGAVCVFTVIAASQRVRGVRPFGA